MSNASALAINFIIQKAEAAKHDRTESPDETPTEAEKDGADAPTGAQAGLGVEQGAAVEPECYITGIGSHKHREEARHDRERRGKVGGKAVNRPIRVEASALHQKERQRERG